MALSESTRSIVIPLGVPGDGAGEEGGAVGRAAGEQLAVGETGVVVDRDVQVLPAGAGAALHAVLEDPFADLVEAAELFRVDVQQLARTVALVADARAAGRSRQPRAAGAVEHLPTVEAGGRAAGDPAGLRSVGAPGRIRLELPGDAAAALRGRGTIGELPPSE